jgi:hypothetical protein
MGVELFPDESPLALLTEAGESVGKGNGGVFLSIVPCCCTCHFYIFFGSLCFRERRSEMYHIIPLSQAKQATG